MAVFLIVRELMQLRASSSISSCASAACGIATQPSEIVSVNKECSSLLM
jgi:hypothetical protein